MTDLSSALLLFPHTYSVTIAASDGVLSYRAAQMDMFGLL